MRFKVKILNANKEVVAEIESNSDSSVNSLTQYNKGLDGEPARYIEIYKKTSDTPHRTASFIDDIYVDTSPEENKRKNKSRKSGDKAHGVHNASNVQQTHVEQKTHDVSRETITHDAHTTHDVSRETITQKTHDVQNRLHITIPTENLEYVKVLAKLKGTSTSDFINQLIANDMNNNKETYEAIKKLQNDIK